MYFKQITVDGMGCFSYVIGCPGAKTCCVVDPKRDIQDYLDISREEGMKITHIFETHQHADHVSGNLELQSRTGADIYFYEGTPIEFAHKTVKEGDVFEFGAAKLQALHTPGHTPFAASYLVTDLTRGDEPWMILTGDLLFVGDVGRPDLAGDEILDEQAHNLYSSLFEKLGKLPDRLEVYPAHGQGSLCGKGMSSKPNTTLGYERITNHAFKHGSEEEFKQAVTGEFPTRPKSFTHIIAANAKGAGLLERCPLDRAMPVAEFKSFMDRGATVIDTRDTSAFGGVHIKDSINIGLEKQTANWVGMVVDPDADLLLVVDDTKDYDEMSTMLHRIGYDKIFGYLDGGIRSWLWQGMPVDQLSQISVQELHAKLHNGFAGKLLDVRTPAELGFGKIDGAAFMPLTDVLDGKYSVDPTTPVYVICGSGYRSNIVASHLLQTGFDEVHSVAGGMFAWANAQLPMS